MRRPARAGSRANDEGVAQADRATTTDPTESFRLRPRGQRASASIQRIPGAVRRDPGPIQRISIVTGRVWAPFPQAFGARPLIGDPVRGDWSRRTCVRWLSWDVARVASSKERATFWDAAATEALRLAQASASPFLPFQRHRPGSKGTGGVSPVFRGKHDPGHPTPLRRASMAPSRGREASPCPVGPLMTRKDSHRIPADIPQPQP